MLFIRSTLVLACLLLAPFVFTQSAFGQQQLPDTFLNESPPASTFVPAAYFEFSSDQVGVNYECRYALVGSPLPSFETCSNPFVAMDLQAGEWILEVRAVHGTNGADPTPASTTWEVTTAIPAGTAPLLKDGEPFPKLISKVTSIAIDQPGQTRYVDPNAAPNGTGGISDPYDDLQFAVTQLAPRDRLVLLPGTYPEIAVISQAQGCVAGSGPNDPIQVIGTPGAVLCPSDITLEESVIRIELAWWQFQGLEFDLEIDPDPTEDGLKMPSFLLVNPDFANGHLFTVSNILIDSCRIFGGSSHGIQIDAGSLQATVSNCEIFEFTSINPIKEKHGIFIRTDTDTIDVLGCHIYANDGDGVQVHGGEMSNGTNEYELQFASNINIQGNHFHDDVENGVDIKSSRHVFVKDNLVHDYDIVEDGEGIVVHYEAFDVTVSGNYVYECVRGFAANRGRVPGGTGSWNVSPECVSVERNFFHDTTGMGGAGIVFVDITAPKVVHNITLGWNTAIRMLKYNPQILPGCPYFLICANNLIAGARDLALHMDALHPAVHQVDGMAFANVSQPTNAKIGGVEKSVVDWINDASCPHLKASYSCVGPNLSMLNNDVCTWLLPGGCSLVDQGYVFTGSPSNPDIGICEH